MTPKDLFEILAREHAEMLTVYLRCTVRDPALADDLFQETMLVAWRNLEKFDRSRPFGPWLRGIAAKLTLAARRKIARGMVLCDQQTLEHLETCCDALQRQTGDTLDDKLDGLRHCLELLPEPYRQAVRLRYTDGIKGESLAAQLQVSIENVKKRLQRGREKLLDCMQRKLALTET